MNYEDNTQIKALWIIAFMSRIIYNIRDMERRQYCGSWIYKTDTGTDFVSLRRKRFYGL